MSTQGKLVLAKVKSSFHQFLSRDDFIAQLLYLFKPLKHLTFLYLVLIRSCIKSDIKAFYFHNFEHFFGVASIFKGLIKIKRWFNNILYFGYKFESKILGK